MYESLPIVWGQVIKQIMMYEDASLCYYIEMMLIYNVNILIHFGLGMLYSDIDLGQHWLR